MVESHVRFGAEDAAPVPIHDVDGSSLVRIKDGQTMAEETFSVDVKEA